MAVAVAWSVAGGIAAAFFFWHLAGFSTIWSGETPAASRPLLFKPSGCIVLELDRTTNHTTPKACPSHI